MLDALQSRPRVLVVEDLHWADEATLDLVRFLGRRIGALPLLLVLSYREAVGAAHPLRAVLGDLVATPDARRLQLTPLSRAAVAELVGGHRPRSRGRARADGGQPVLRQPDPRAAGLADAGERARRRGRPHGGPHAGGPRALELLSCTPEGVSGALLAALDVPPATVEALDATGLLDRRGRGVAFRHEIARSAVLGAVPPGAEPALHAR